jgi:hypothetical protein
MVYCVFAYRSNITGDILGVVWCEARPLLPDWERLLPSVLRLIRSEIGQETGTV